MRRFPSWGFRNPGEIRDSFHKCEKNYRTESEWEGKLSKSPAAAHRRGAARLRKTRDARMSVRPVSLAASAWTWLRLGMETGIRPGRNPDAALPRRRSRHAGK